MWIEKLHFSHERYTGCFPSWPDKATMHIFKWEVSTDRPLIHLVLLIHPVSPNFLEVLPVHQCWRKAYSEVLFAWYSFRTCWIKDKLKLLTHLKAWPIKYLGPFSTLTLFRRKVLSGDLVRSVNNLISNFQAILWLLYFLLYALALIFQLSFSPFYLGDF